MIMCIISVRQLDARSSSMGAFYEGLPFRYKTIMDGSYIYYTCPPDQRDSAKTNFVQHTIAGCTIGG